ncbi:MAG: SLC13 family permease [Bacteroidales bacterium]|nr:SLC13 family permease [Bacteroidales bacterium]
MFTIEIIIVLVVLVLAITMFATEYFSVDIVALIIMVTLIVSGVISPTEGVSGFSNSATITVAAMFILSAALFKSGAVVGIGNKLAELFQFNFWIAIVATMIVVGTISAFINNTPVVAIFIPILAGAAAKSGHSLGRMLMPLSFASMFGGVCTLIGTSTNILVSGIAAENGLEPFSMFEMSKLGIIFFGTGILYMFFIGIHLIPDRENGKDLVKKFGMGDYLTEIILETKAPSVGKKIKDSPLVKNLDIDILEVKRQGQKYFMPSGEMIFEAGDILKVRCDLEKIRTLKEREGIKLKSDAKFQDQDMETDELTLVEAVIAPNSQFEGKTVKQIGFRQRYGATVLAIRHRGEIMREKVANTVLRSGDTLLIEAQMDKLDFLRQLQLHGRNTFLIVSEVAFQKFKTEKIALVVATIAAIILIASLNILPIMVAALAGCVFLILTGCITMEESYRAIDWKVIFLLAGAMSLGVALDRSGAAVLISDFLINIVGAWGPIAIVSVLYLLTSIMTETMSNNASAVLLAPIAIAASITMEVDARPFLMAITFAASSSFMTPIGYQTNTMIYGTGNYKFMDFVKVGGPLNLIFWIIATFMIPYFFPF